MSEAGDRAASARRVALLDRIATSGQEWPAVARKWGVDNPVPPWRSSLEGICDALDGSGLLPPLERREREDELSGSLYADLPPAEGRLLALAHTLIERGVISEEELSRHVESVRARLDRG